MTCRNAPPVLHEPTSEGDEQVSLPLDPQEPLRAFVKTAPHAQVTVDLLLIPNCPNEASAERLIHTALADVRLPSVPVRKIVTADGADAARRGFTGSDDPHQRH